MVNRHDISAEHITFDATVNYAPNLNKIVVKHDSANGKFRLFRRSATALPAPVNGNYIDPVTDTAGTYWLQLPLGEGGGGGTPDAHTHAIGDVTGLQAALDDKAASSHTHTGYASSTHSHAIGDVTGLQTALDGKSASNHTHSGLAPIGGTTGQVLKKTANGDYAYAWADDATGGGGSSIASTDELAEGSTNLYFTEARAQAITHDNTTSDIFKVGVGQAGVDKVVEAVSTGTDANMTFRVKGSGKIKFDGASYVLADPKLVVMDSSGEILAQHDILENQVAVPPNLTTSGFAGQWAYETGFLYYCVGPNLWLKIRGEDGTISNMEVYVAIPPTPTSAGKPGQRAYDATNSLTYECVATNTWIRYSIVKTW